MMTVPVSRTKVPLSCTQELIEFVLVVFEAEPPKKRKGKKRKRDKAQESKKKKRKKAKKNPSLDFSELDKEMEEDAERKIEGPEKEEEARLSPFEEKVKKLMMELEPFHVGRVCIDPRKLKLPPKEAAVRALIKDHLTRMYLEIDKRRTSVGAKDLILIMENVNFFLQDHLVFLFRFPKKNYNVGDMLLHTPRKGRKNERRRSMKCVGTRCMFSVGNILSKGLLFVLRNKLKLTETIFLMFGLIGQLVFMLYPENLPNIHCIWIVLGS